MRFCLMFFFFIVCSTTIAQTISFSNKKIENLVTAFKIKSPKQTIEAYQIQIFSNDDRMAIENCKKKFNANFPQRPIKKIHEAPYFKLTTGLYLTKKVAEEQLKIIKNIFPTSFIFKEAVPVTNLKNEEH